MQKRILLNAMLMSALLAYVASTAASTGTPVAAQSHQGMAADEHAGHGRAAMNKPKAWTGYPILKIRMSGENRESRVIAVVPQGMVANRIEAYSNNIDDTGGRRQLPLDMAGAKLDKPETGGYHWLAAREEQGDKVKVASTVYFFSERGAQNPTALFMQQKHELEVIPQPYPREHSRYRANEEWKFMVRFNGQPLVGQKVNLETRNGTKAELLSDAQGVITVRIPDDFKEEVQQKGAGSHDHGRRSSDFVLAAEHVENGKTYLTAFNASYGTDAFDQRSLVMGLGFTVLGMIGATPLLRQRKKSQPAAAETANHKDS